MKTNFVKSRWLFTMLLFVTTMFMPTMMLAEESITPTRPEGDGKTEPYQISTAAELYWFAGLVNGTLENVKQDASANAILTADIIVNEGVLDANKDLVSGKDFIPWTPIGNFYDGYTGTFNGKEHTISGLYFNKPNYNVGLFGWLGAKGKISNVGVLDSYFQFSTEGGGVCGSNYGELQNCSNSSTVIGTESSVKIGGVCGMNYGNGTVRDCKNTGSVRGNDYVGGVCGFNEKGGIIENSFNEGTVNGTGNYVDHVGGVCGESRGTIKSCYNTAPVSGTGKYVGGVCGNNSDVTSTITNCFNEGTVSATGDYAEDVGGVSGYNNGTIKSCYNTASVSGQYCVGGVCGGNSCGPITNCFNIGTVVCGTQYSVGGVCGDNYEGPITYCYYLSGTVADGKGGIGRKDDVPGKAEKMSLERFKSGEVAWLLNGSPSVSTEESTLAWYQKLGENGDAYPVLTSTGENTVYEAYQHGSRVRFFSNTVQHSTAYNTEAEDEANGNHDLSYEAGEYTWTEAEDKTQVPSVAVTYTCKVCGKTEKPQMTVAHDEEHDNVEATCTEDGHKYYKTSYAFNAKAIFSNAYTQTLPALGHNMSEDVTFNDSKSIYQKGCTRNCGHNEYFATSDASVAAQPNDDASAFTVDKFTLNDATAYDSKAEFTVTNLEYKRSFSHDKWQAVYVPFSIDCGQLSDEYEMATINNFHEFEQKDGSFNTVLEVKPVKNSITIPALTPCLIRMKQAPETAEAKTLQFTNVSFAAAADKKIDCASVTRYYQFLGTLNAKTGFDTTSDFVINEGELWKAGSDTELNPQRWYLNASDRTGSELNPSVQLSRIAIHVIGGDETTDIDGIYVKTDTEDVSSSRQGIYDLQGRKLSEEPTSGIYIKDGKKYVK